MTGATEIEAEQSVARADGVGVQVSMVEKKPHFRTRGGHAGRRPLMGEETAM